MQETPEIGIEEEGVQLGSTVHVEVHFPEELPTIGAYFISDFGEKGPEGVVSISKHTPFAQAVLGAHVGDTVLVKAEVTYEVKILSTEPY